MITPCKSITFKDSIIYRMTYILDVDFDEISLVDLYHKTKSKFQGIDEFIYSIDTLHLLSKVDVNFELGRIRKC